MQELIEKIIVDIIQKELNLPDNYGATPRGDEIPCVTVYAQNIKLYNTEKLQITVKTLTCKPYSNRISYIDDPENEGGQIEVIDINQSHLIQVDIYSKNDEAIKRYLEVAAALKSTYAEQMEAQYGFKIGILPDIINLSGLGGGSDINRYTLTFNVIYHYEKTKPVDYYNAFKIDTYTQNGLISQIEIGE